MFVPQVNDLHVGTPPCGHCGHMRCVLSSGPRRWDRTAGCSGQDPTAGCSGQARTRRRAAANGPCPASADRTTLSAFGSRVRLVHGTTLGQTEGPTMIARRSADRSPKRSRVRVALRMDQRRRGGSRRPSGWLAMRALEFAPSDFSAKRGLRLGIVPASRTPPGEHYVALRRFAGNAVGIRGSEVRSLPCNGCGPRLTEEERTGDMK